MICDLRFAIDDYRAARASTRKSQIVNRTWLAWLGAALLFLLLAGVAVAEQRFPPPDFESGHKLPVTATPPARAIYFQYLDIAVLAGCLGLGSWVV